MMAHEATVIQTVKELEKWLPEECEKGLEGDHPLT